MLACITAIFTKNRRRIRIMILLRLTITLVFVMTFMGVCSQNVLTDTLKLKLDDNVRGMIDFGVTFSGQENKMKEPEMELKTYVDRKLPEEYIPVEENKKPHVTMIPYNCFIKWNENPIKGLGVMIAPELLEFDKTSREYVPGIAYSSGSPMSGGAGAGVVFEFNMDDVIGYLFSKSHRAKMYNRKHAKAWKYYNTEQPAPSALTDTVPGK